MLLSYLYSINTNLLYPSGIYYFLYPLIKATYSQLKNNLTHGYSNRNRITPLEDRHYCC